MPHHSSLITHHCKIGLLGGSFNPAHAGHLHLSAFAQRHLQLDRIIWLVSPQNPLKRREDMAPYAQRFAHAQRVAAACPFITVSDWEKQNRCYYSIDTITQLQQRHRTTHFVWLMGADNLQQFHRWRGWQQLLRCVPIAVFDRAPFSHHALRAPAAQYFAARRLPMRQAAALANSDPPAWSYLFMPRHPQSATHLRNSLGDKAFLCHTKYSE